MSFSILLGCPDDLPDEPTDAGLVIDYCDGLLDCNDVSVQEPDTKKTAVDAAAQQLCSTVWDFNVTEGGVPSHPVVNSEGTVIATYSLTSGNIPVASIAFASGGLQTITATSVAAGRR